MSHLLDSSFYVIHKKTILNLHHTLVHICILEIPLFSCTQKADLKGVYMNFQATLLCFTKDKLKFIIG